jgi:hypothetical protein
MLQQHIDRPLSARNEVLNTTGLVATPFTGGTSTTVLRFNGAATFIGPQGAVQVPTWLTSVNDANLGTVVTIFKPGIYAVDFYLQIVATAMVGFDVTYGISQDVGAAGLIAVPSFATAGVLSVGRLVTIATELIVPVQVTVPVTVSPEQSIAGSAIRFQAALTAGGAPVDALTPDVGGAWFRIRAENQLHQ